MLDELRLVLQESRTLPREGQLSNQEMAEALRDFKGSFNTPYTGELTARGVLDFVGRHRLLESMGESLSRIKRVGKRVVIIEGADGTGKTTLAEVLARRMGGAAIENQSAKVFETMFELPKIYKTTVVEYNSNVLIGLLFYMVVNTIALRIAAERFEGGEKHVFMDSSIIRTMASNVSRPAVGERGGGDVVIESEARDLIEKGLNGKVVEVMEARKEGLAIVMLYASDKAIARQLAERGGVIDDYDTNREYASITNRFLLGDQITLRKGGVPVLSIYLNDSKAGGTGNDCLKNADVEILQQGLGPDTEKKAEAVGKFLQKL